MSAFLSRLACHVVGYLYPAYKTYKAVETNDDGLYAQWLTYWIVNTCVFSLEFILDLLLPLWLPFYLQLKVVFFLWLVSPHSKGASLLYKNLIQPYLTHYESDIDENVSILRKNFSNQLSSIGKNSMLKVQTSGVEILSKAMVQMTQMQQQAEMHRRESVQHAVGSRNLNDNEREVVEGFDYEQERDRFFSIKKVE